MKKQDADAIWTLSKRIKGLEEQILKFRGERDEHTRQRKIQLERFEVLMTQLNKHTNPTRDEVALLKRTNRELARELLQVHELLKKEHPES